MRATLLLPLLSLALAACGGGTKDSAAEDDAADGASDGSADGGADGASDDGGADGASDDGGADGTSDDGGADGTSDDGGAHDGASDDGGASDGGDDGGAALACAAGTDRVSASAAEGVWSASLQTEDTTAWTCLSLADGAQLTAGYTMAWQQWTVALGAGVEAQVLPDTAFDAVSAAPAEGWTTDADAVFGDWYLYDGATHTLSARPHLFLLRGADGAAFKLQIISYYDAEGTVHRPQLRWAALAGG